MAAPPLAIDLHLVFDGSGETARRVAVATVSQFDHLSCTLVFHPRVTDPDTLGEITDDIVAGRRQALVFYTLADERLRVGFAAALAERGIVNVDILGAPLASIDQLTGEHPALQSGRSEMLERSYFERIEAIEFAVKYDDGKQPDGMLAAEVVLIGVSRTGKTPLSIYLGYLGYKAANQPLVATVPPPSQLFEVDPQRVIGLRVDPERLSLVRAKRVSSMSGARRAGGYAELEGVYAELEAADKIMRRIGCAVIDVTNLAIEETARQVLSRLRRIDRPAEAPGPG